MLKAELRKKYLQKRTALSVQQTNKLDDLLLIRFQSLQLEIPAVLMSYLPYEKAHEFDPVFITDFCAFRHPGLQLAYPVVDTNTLCMQAVAVHDDTDFIQNTYGIAEPAGGAVVEPAAIGMVIVPLLAYDVRGYRVGYGKGYYDRFLQMCGPDIISIGFSYFAAEDAIDDIHDLDVKMHYCICPEKVYDFTND